MSTGHISIPGYEVSGILGRGGFGIVYRARQLTVGREVALKVDNRVLLSDRDRRRFMREVTAVGRLSGHPHVVEIYDAGVLSDGRPYMVLELCPGGSLADRLRNHGPLGVREVRDVGVRIADALAAAHAAGVLHRDVKPANILINRYGVVALSDFGLAAIPPPGARPPGVQDPPAPGYAPPEAFEPGEPTAAGDVYALAATLYALLSARPPRFPATGGVNMAQIMALHRLPIPDIPGVQPEFIDMLRQAMAADPRMRFQTAGALREALAGLQLEETPPPVPRKSAVTVSTSPRRASARLSPLSSAGLPSPTALPPAPARSPWPSRVYAVLAAFFAALLIVGVTVMVMQGREEAAEARPAQQVLSG